MNKMRGWAPIKLLLTDIYEFKFVNYVIIMINTVLYNLTQINSSINSSDFMNLTCFDKLNFSNFF